MFRICVNAANLHNGGGIQVAASLIDELSNLITDKFEISVLASNEVYTNIKQMGVNTSVFGKFKNFNTYGLNALVPKNSKETEGYDLVFTVFGPDYNFFSRSLRVTGFAQAWILYPDNETYQSYSLLGKLKSRLKFYLQALFFKRSAALVVELDHVRNGLGNRGFELNKIHVVRNCISNIYFQPERWGRLVVKKHPGRFCLGFIGRDYPHKNTNILPVIKDRLFESYGVEVDFYVTFSDDEWAAKSQFFKSKIKNVGVLNVAECPAFYKAMDAVIFPSLLECFSATPLESLVMERPLFASDRDFVRDICGEYAYYFDPVDPDSAAEVICSYMSICRGGDRGRIKLAKEHVVNFSNARGRALAYMDIWERVISENTN